MDRSHARVLCAASAAVYEDGAPGSKFLEAAGYKTLESYRGYEMIFDSDTFKAIAYIHEGHKHIIVAIRGTTVRITDILVDIASAVTGVSSVG